MVSLEWSESSVYLFDFLSSLRVISYNILADQYADSEFARTNLFPSCPAYAIDMDYRKHLLLKEISGEKQK